MSLSKHSYADAEKSSAGTARSSDPPADSNHPQQPPPAPQERLFHIYKTNPCKPHLCELVEADKTTPAYDIRYHQRHSPWSKANHDMIIRRADSASYRGHKTEGTGPIVSAIILEAESTFNPVEQIDVEMTTGHVKMRWEKRSWHSFTDEGRKYAWKDKSGKGTLFKVELVDEALPDVMLAAFEQKCGHKIGRLTVVERVRDEAWVDLVVATFMGLYENRQRNDRQRNDRQRRSRN